MLLNFNKTEQRILQRLNTPAKIQDFINKLEFNFEEDGETFKSPLRVLRTGNAHCLEGATFAAYLLSLHGFSPLLLHLEAVKEDFDHVVAPFKVDGLWGAISKTNHSVLRYREPVYRDIHELVMSYFHEYFLDSGKKTLRKYSGLLNLNTFEHDYHVADEDLWGIDEALDELPHHDVLPKDYVKKLRKADEIEISAGKIVEYERKSQKQKN